MSHLRRYNRILPLVLAITTTAPATVRAQETTGTVRGVVPTSEGDPLKSADVVVEGPQLASFRLAVTDGRGRTERGRSEPLFIGLATGVWEGASESTRTIASPGCRPI